MRFSVALLAILTEGMLLTGNAEAQVARADPQSKAGTFRVWVYSDGSLLLTTRTAASRTLSAAGAPCL